jgi:signal transduction histidine kinase
VDEDSVTIEFRDNGMGIAPEHVKHIFDPFFTTRLGQGGSGLGLSIVHNIVEALLGGHVRLNAADEIIGACFILELPLHAPQEEETQTETELYL